MKVIILISALCAVVAAAPLLIAVEGSGLEIDADFNLDGGYEPDQDDLEVKRANRRDGSGLEIDVEADTSLAGEVELDSPGC